MRRARASRCAAATAAAAAAGLTLPAGIAHAAQLTALTECYATGETVPISGSGFTPDAPVTVRVQDGLTHVVPATAGGRLLVNVKAPRVDAGMVRPRSFTVTAEDSVDPAAVSTVSMFVTRTRPISNAPVTGTPTAATTWQFAGFDERRMIYGHFRLRGRTVRTVRFGRATAQPCGYLRVRARRVPVPVSRLRAGRWRLQLDHQRRYDSNIRPRYVVTFSILRSPRLGG